MRIRLIDYASERVVYLLAIVLMLVGLVLYKVIKIKLPQYF